jgi:paraquat-inducible protein B
VTIRANPTVIGAFAVGAIGLLIVAAFVFGSGKIFSTRPRAVVFFQGSLQGLNVGAPVNLRGVQIGTVSDIRLDLDVKTMQPSVPVYLAFDTDRFALTDLPSAALKGQQPLKIAIANGLHARLTTQSLVTGQLLVELDLDPEEPRNLVGADPSTIEIPTSQSDIEKLKRALMELPLAEIADKALLLLSHADQVLSSPEIPKLLESLVALAGNANGLVSDTRSGVGPVIDDVRETARASREALGAAQQAMLKMETTLTTANQVMASDVREAVKTATAALQRAEKVMTDADSLIAASSPQRYDLNEALKNLTATSRSLRLFSDELQRRPNAMLMGK